MAGAAANPTAKAAVRQNRSQFPLAIARNQSGRPLCRPFIPLTTAILHRRVAVRKESDVNPLSAASKFRVPPSGGREDELELLASEMEAALPGSARFQRADTHRFADLLYDLTLLRSSKYRAAGGRLHHQGGELREDFI